MNVSQEVNRHLAVCIRVNESPQHKKDIKGLARFIEKVARKRLEDLEEFVDTLDTLPPNGPIQRLKITQQIVDEFDELDYAISVAERILGNSP